MAKKDWQDFVLHGTWEVAARVWERMIPRHPAWAIGRKVTMLGNKGVVRLAGLSKVEQGVGNDISALGGAEWSMPLSHPSGSSGKGWEHRPRVEIENWIWGHQC